MPEIASAQPRNVILGREATRGRRTGVWPEMPEIASPELRNVILGRESDPRTQEQLEGRRWPGSVILTASVRWAASSGLAPLVRE